MNARRWIVLCLLIAPLLLSHTAGADSAGSQQEAAQLALQRAGGDATVLSVESDTDQSGNTIYSVKVLTDGRVRIYRIPQRSR